MICLEIFGISKMLHLEACEVAAARLVQPCICRPSSDTTSTTSFMSVPTAHNYVGSYPKPSLALLVIAWQTVLYCCVIFVCKLWTAAASAVITAACICHQLLVASCAVDTQCPHLLTQTSSMLCDYQGCTSSWACDRGWSCDMTLL